MRKIPKPGVLERYWLALGKFAHRYAEVEFVMNQVLRIVAGVGVKEAQALFSGTRASDAMNFIKRINEGKDETLDPMLARAFPKLVEITTIRNQILHNGFRFKGDRVFASDLHRNMPNKVRSILISADDLDNLEIDVNTIHACLSVYWIEQRWPSFDRNALEHARARALEPWRYKSPQPENSRRHSRGKNRERRPPPKS